MNQLTKLWRCYMTRKATNNKTGYITMGDDDSGIFLTAYEEVPYYA